MGELLSSEERARLAARPHGGTICIVGGPNSGKTTLATKLSYDLSYVALCSDTFIDRKLENQFYVAAERSASHLTTSPKVGLILEGVHVAKALEIWCYDNPNAVPCDVLLILDRAFEEHNRYQRGLQTAVARKIDSVLRTFPLLHPVTRKIYSHDDR